MCVVGACVVVAAASAHRVRMISMLGVPVGGLLEAIVSPPPRKSSEENFVHFFLLHSKVGGTRGMTTGSGPRAST